MVIRPLSRTSLVLDIVGAFVLFSIFTPTSVVFYAPGNLSSTVPEAVGIGALVVAAVLQCGAVAIGRLAPGIALAVAWVGAIVQMAAGLGPLPINVAILGVLYATAAWGTTRVFWAGLVSSFVGGIIAAAYIAFTNGQLFTAGISSTVASFVLLAFMSILALGSPWLGGFGWRMVLRWRVSREKRVRDQVS